MMFWNNLNRQSFVLQIYIPESTIWLEPINKRGLKYIDVKLIHSQLFGILLRIDTLMHYFRKRTHYLLQVL